MDMQEVMLFGLVALIVVVFFGFGYSVGRERTLHSREGRRERG